MHFGALLQSEKKTKLSRAVYKTQKIFLFLLLFVNTHDIKKWKAHYEVYSTVATKIYYGVSVTGYHQLYLLFMDPIFENGSTR